jgi:hypothetical protein
MSVARRWSIGLLSLMVLLAFPVAFSVANSLPSANALLRLAGAPDGQHRETARRNGFLLSFLSEIPAFFQDERVRSVRYLNDLLFLHDPSR